MKPLKTLCYTGAIVGALSLAGIAMSNSYVRTGANMAGEQLRSSVPTDFEIERLDLLVNDLDATLATQRSRLVKQQVDLDYLRQEVEAASVGMRDLEEEVRAARVLLQDDNATYTLAGREFSRERIIAEAHNKAEALVRARSTVKAKSETLAALEDALHQADEQIAAARRQRQTYAMRLAELRANAEHVAMRKELVTTLGTLPGEIDTGAFQQVEETFARIEREIEVQHRLLDGGHGEVPRDRIVFDGEEDMDIMAVLGRALEEDQAVASASDETPTILP